jgi:membrane associated rhomboid family serine protease
VSWEERQYGNDQDPRYYGGGGGVRSFFGGLPALTKAVKWILLANVAMFVLCQVGGGSTSSLYRALSMQTEAVLGGQIWRLVTFTYLHDQAGFSHLFFNMLALYFLGVPLEQVWGAKRFFIFYTIGGFVGVLLYFIMTTVGPLSPIGSLVGASGGVLAVLGACAVLFPGIRIWFIPIRIMAVIFVVLYTLNLGKQGANAGGDACHLAGLAFGIAWTYRGGFLSERWSQWRTAVDSGRWEAKQRRRAAEMEEVDRILEKVLREGMNSLSRGEKKTLAVATRREQEADRRHGL